MIYLLPHLFFTKTFISKRSIIPNYFLRKSDDDDDLDDDDGDDNNNNNG
jgi:hypothetical protein